MPAKGGGEDPPSLELCPDFTLRVAERLVTVEGEGITDFFNRAEDVEGCKVAPLPFSLHSYDKIWTPRSPMCRANPFCTSHLCAPPSHLSSWWTGRALWTSSIGSQM